MTSDAFERWRQLGKFLIVCTCANVPFLPVQVQILQFAVRGAASGARSHIRKHWLSCLYASAQYATPKVVAGLIIEHASFNSDRDQFVHVKVFANRKIVLANLKI
jgi:hypothetical protein